MKKLTALLFALMISTNVFSATKCAPDGRGGICCWDTVEEGPWKPATC